MNNFNTKIIKALSQNLSIDKIVCNEIQDSINFLLRTELTAFLDYEKYDPIGYNTGNSRNGTYERDLETKYGEITVTIPRDRNGEFKQEIIEPYNRRTPDLENAVLQLYSKGVTTAEIASLIEKMYGHAYTPQTVSNITKMVEADVEAFRTRPIGQRFVVLYCDATMLNVRRDTVAKEALHIIVGITPNGNKEVLDYRLYPQESASNYEEMLMDLKTRGLEKVLLIVTDGLAGIKDACLNVFPKAKHQSCWVHVQRNVAKSVRAKERKEILDMVKPLYQSDSEVEARKKFKVLKSEILKRYPKVIKILETNESLYSFYSFPKAIHKSLYTTNLVEGLNKQLKRQTKKKEQFPNEESLERFVCQYMLSYNLKFDSKVHRGFGEVQSEVEEMFEKTYNYN